MTKVLVLCCCLFTALFATWGIVRFSNYMSFEIGCGGHLKRAADANTIELAAAELEQAIVYAEKHDLTKGSTHLLFATPDLDIGFWYKNISSARNELREVSPNASNLEKTNMLMKLRETLVDSGQSVHITVPDGIYVFPFGVG
jgi:hypothetical protein